MKEGADRCPRGVLDRSRAEASLSRARTIRYDTIRYDAGAVDCGRFEREGRADAGAGLGLLDSGYGSCAVL